ncbi:MAG: LCP family protein [Chloroflexi bacterium]|nr:LCP family protein [Chloroflexota bacterium]
MRLCALAAGLLAAGLVLVLGLAMLARLYLPEWYALPGEVLRMTGQRVPAATPVAAAPIVAVPTVDAPVIATDTPTVVAPRAAHVEETVQPAPTPEATPTPVPVTDDADPATLLPDRRFTVLLLGSDNDLKFSPNAVLTQAMILVSIDPSTHNVSMISIPRDFWVPIPGYGYQKIDVAYEVGGIALARRTVETLFNVKIDYYAWVGLNGLVQVIDTLGGIDVNVQHPILDEMYPDDLNTGDPYAYFRLYIPAGPQHLDGTRALEYVRSRHGDLLSDFGRSERQQQVLLAIKNRVQSVPGATRMPQLVSALDGSVKSDLSVPAILQLAAMSRDVHSENIHQQVLSAPDFAWLGYSPDGTQQVVFPNWPAIRPVIARLLS